MNSNTISVLGPEQQARRRRVLFAALQPFMKRDALYQALWDWEEQYANRPAASLHKFIATLCSAPPLTAQRNEINRSLVVAMQPGDTALGPDPMNEMLAYRRRVGGATPVESGRRTAATRAPANTVLEVILSGLNGRLARHTPAVYPSYIRYVVENLPALRLPANTEMEVASFIQKAADGLKALYPPEAMQALVHLLYLGACEYFGPVKTDEMLAAAVAEAEQLPEAMLFPPRTLL